jgi:peptide/nickel transport system substrate-binding protein
LCRLLPLALVTLAACSSGEWEPPPPGRSTTQLDEKQVARIVEELVRAMKEGGIYEMEVDHAESGLRLRLDRRKTTGAVFAAPASTTGEGASEVTEVVDTTEDSEPEPMVVFQPVSAAEVTGPGPRPVDVFNPDMVEGEELTPLYGGRVIIHTPSLPENLCYPIENSAYTRRWLREVHESLLLRDWEYLDYGPSVAKSWIVEDMLVLVNGAESRYSGAKLLRVKPQGEEEQSEAFVLFGEVSETPTGWRVEPKTEGGSALGAETLVSADDVSSVQQGSVFTFQLREDAIWHPAEGISGHALDARDVYFSWSIYANPGVDCDEKRYLFEKMTACEIIDAYQVRFFYESQYFGALASLAEDLTLLPSHIYDLSDPDNPAYDAQATESDQALAVNENPHNTMWVGLGPYRVTEWTQQWVQAERFDDYFDEERPGYFDAIRWRYIDDDSASFQALLNGELDFFKRVKSADYFGAATEKEEFTESFYKGYMYDGSYGYTGWNTLRPHLSDKRVRQALAHAFNSSEYLINNYRNLARQVTGPFPFSSPAYNHDVKPYPYDPDKARSILEDAGWYDRNGDGVVDRDGVELVVEFMMPSGNEASKNLGLVMQEQFAEIGVKVNIVQFEWATFLERFKSRDFDGANLAWVPDLESDPEPLWHSKWGDPEKRGSNSSAVRETELDALIAKGQVELDFEKRQGIWKEIHTFLYDHQPYLFGFNVPRKFAMSKRIRGFQMFAIDPSFSIRRWHFTDLAEPGTRTTRTR